MANSSGFIDFNQYVEQNAPEEQRLLEQAMQRAEAAQGRSQLALRKAEAEGQGRYGADGLISGEKALSQTASYSDYLKANAEASAAWAAVTSRSRDPRASALQGSIGGDAKGRAAQAMGDAAARESRAGANLDSNLVARTGDRSKRLSDAATKRAADEARAQTEAGWREDYVRSMMTGAKGRAAAGGAQRDYVGMFNPAADSGWARQQGAWEAQQIKNAGGGQTAQQGVWDAYTGKGSAGYGRTPANRYEPMQAEMGNFDGSSQTRPQWAPPRPVNEEEEG